MKASLLVVALPLMAVLAGCITDTDTPPTPMADGCTSPLDQDGVQSVDAAHDPITGLTLEEAWNFDLVNKRTCSLLAIGHSPLSPDGVPHKYIGEIDMRGDLGIGAVAVLGNGEAPRVYLVDITDRANPEPISFIEQQNTYIVDVKISDDGALLFTASQKLPTGGLAAEGLPPLEGPTGFTVYDISDPSMPVNVLTFPDPQVGCHMLSHEFIGDTEVLFCVSQQVRAYTLERTAAGVVVTGFVDHFPMTDGLPQPSGLPVGDPTGMLPLSSGPHDMTVTKDPVDGRTYAVISHWNAGVRVVDVTDFPQMREVGVWTGEGATHYDGNVHTAMMFYVGEDRYIMASPELTYDGIVPSMWVLDANDLSDLKLVGEWFHPGEHTSQGLYLTTHQWQVAPTGADVNASEVRVYLTYNHAGVWVLDLGRILEKDHQGAILGYNLARTPLDQDNAVGNAVLSTWDVNVVDGYIYGSDRATGLWVFHYEEDMLGDTRITGFA